MKSIPTSWVDRRVKHASHGRMKTITVRDVQQRWPEAEQALETEEEIIITRDGKPVARLLPVEPEVEPPRKRFNAEAHRRWMEEMWGGETFDTLTHLMESREERILISKSALATLAALDDEDDLAPEDSNSER